MSTLGFGASLSEAAEQDRGRASDSAVWPMAPATGTGVDIFLRWRHLVGVAEDELVLARLPLRGISLPKQMLKFTVGAAPAHKYSSTGECFDSVSNQRILQHLAAVCEAVCRAGLLG